MRRILAISSIGNQPHNLHGKYIPGSGVGASSVATRRLKLQKAAPCYASTPPQIQYLRVSDIATLNGSNEWILNSNTVITPYQYLIIYNSGTPQNPGPVAEDLHIPGNMTFTNNGRVDNYGSFKLETGTSPQPGATVYNTSVFNNYGSLIISNNCEFYTYGGGSVFNSNALTPQADISIPAASGLDVIGIFALPPISGSGCGTGTFTGKAISNSGVVTYVCPP